MNRSRSTLFLIEQLIVTAIFAICTAICVTLLTDSYVIANNSRDKSRALRAAQNAAECFKAVSGDAVESVVTLGGNPAELEIYYSDNWQISSKVDASYILSFTELPPETEGIGALSVYEISVSKSNGLEIVSLTIAARRDAE